jgi:general secretion pathway protein F
MPIFRYKGYGNGGKEAAGTIEADGLKDAALKVRDMGLHPRLIEPYAQRRRAGLLRRSQGGSLPALTRQLSVLLRSGVPLAEALRALSEESGGQWRGMLVDIKERVIAGASLSRAMKDYEGTFPDFYTSLVTAGEESGTLDTVLGRLADYLESIAEAKEKIRTAMVYPLFMAGVSVVVLAFIFTFVVPKIVKIFEDTQSALPLATVVLIGISNVFVNYWWLLAGAALAVVAGGRAAARKYRKAVHRGLFRLLGGLYLARFSRTLGFLLKGGLPMLQSLELAGKASGNLYMEEVAVESALSVSEGTRLSSALSGLPPVLLQLIATGERSGTLPDVLGQAAGAYEAEFDRRVGKGLALLEPVMILLMGLVVGFIVFAVLLPMFELNQLIG